LNKISPLPLILERLSDGYPALTPAAGGRLAEAASVALEIHKHLNPVSLTVRGVYTMECALEFLNTTEQLRRTYGDPDENTEEGACGIALLLLMNLTEHTVVRRSRKGTGVDYFLGDVNDFLFQNTARLEVSGIGKGTEQEIKKRVKQKKEQTEQSDHLTIPVYVVIVEFSQPVTEIIFRDAARSNGTN
jgi:hypothetical protein